MRPLFCLSAYTPQEDPPQQDPPEFSVFSRFSASGTGAKG